MQIPKATQILYTIIGKKTTKQKEQEKIKILKEIIQKQKQQQANHAHEHAQNIAQDHYVDQITVAKPNGNIVTGTNNKNYPQAIKSSSIYEYIQSEYPGTRMLTIKDKDKYNTIYQHNNKIYHIETQGELSLIETKKIAQQLEQGIQKYGTDEKK